jgi:hypothetical protein
MPWRGHIPANILHVAGHTFVLAFRDWLRISTAGIDFALSAYAHQVITGLQW